MGPPFDTSRPIQSERRLEMDVHTPRNEGQGNDIDVVGRLRPEGGGHGGMLVQPVKAIVLAVPVERVVDGIGDGHYWADVRIGRVDVRV